ncbi:hypothetical protein DFR70_101616 [Nocardia tenerifensis]|uniref:Uncharacterized protein n=1 Tax=Nocardia tenerifensis TaxID=228006 RepID=A0A318KZB2_9NOCA|nr:hypothetical protein DFR70_101616 [Nocardia tenerifensis]
MGWKIGRGGLMVGVGVASVVFVVGTVVQGFVIVNRETLGEMMVLAGADPGGADGFLVGFRVVGCVYAVGNAVGVLALWRRPWGWLFWVVLGVNGTQAVGLIVVPPEMFAAARAEFGWVGVLPSLVTDGGAAIVAVVLLGVLAVTRRPWGQPKDPRGGARTVLVR